MKFNPIPSLSLSFSLSLSHSLFLSLPQSFFLPLPLYFSLTLSIPRVVLCVCLVHGPVSLPTIIKIRHSLTPMSLTTTHRLHSPTVLERRGGIKAKQSHICFLSPVFHWTDQALSCVQGDKMIQ